MHFALHCVLSSAKHDLAFTDRIDSYVTHADLKSFHDHERLISIRLCREKFSCRNNNCEFLSVPKKVMLLVFLQSNACLALIFCSRNIEYFKCNIVHIFYYTFVCYVFLFDLFLQLQFPTQRIVDTLFFFVRIAWRMYFSWKNERKKYFYFLPTSKRKLSLKQEWEKLFETNWYILFIFVGSKLLFYNFLIMKFFLF